MGLMVLIANQKSLPDVLQLLGAVSSQGVDIQLKILQALLSILTHNRDAHNEVLGDVCLGFYPPVWHHSDWM